MVPSCTFLLAIIGQRIGVMALVVHPYSACANARQGGDGVPPWTAMSIRERWYPTSRLHRSQRRQCYSLPLNKVLSVSFHP